ncbi:hypothetical protein AMJ52_03800 [candidate division TA06 bacterium DG_78]|uniref:DUF1844 domain-containing protein n=1 Tax=candidate division TA06 bacterium DG_78 TaxID=1703772 RepID=A0A0S7YG47_UNCT6|nr:MAG: hypothetical protein AMJ52_03800 [candidate division TA06 bacterium DG_78]
MAKEKDKRQDEKKEPKKRKRLREKKKSEEETKVREPKKPEETKIQEEKIRAEEAETTEEKRTEEKYAQEQMVLEEPVKVKDLLLMYILSLESKAWAYLDLIAHPETQKHKKDLSEAKFAIDAIDALYKIYEEQWSADEKKDIQIRLTNLRLNFVKE